MRRTYNRYSVDRNNSNTMAGKQRGDFNTINDTTIKKQIDALIDTLGRLTGLGVGYNHAYGNHYQLFVYSDKEATTGRIDKTIGQVTIGQGNFYHMLKTAVDLQYAIINFKYWNKARRSSSDIKRYD
jgi:hypothetical protein